MIEAAIVFVVLLVILALAAWIDRLTRRGIGPIEDSVQRTFVPAPRKFTGRVK